MAKPLAFRGALSLQRDNPLRQDSAPGQDMTEARDDRLPPTDGGRQTGVGRVPGQAVRDVGGGEEPAGDRPQRSGRASSPSALSRFSRRALDIAVSLIVLVPASPVLLLAALGIRLSSPGPVLFRSTRIGQDGAPFAMLKLRTMHAGRSDSFLVDQADGRVFALGWALRKARVDELPQLLNVLSGRMALVGPRPRMASVVDGYYTDRMRQSLAWRPGLTSPGTLYQIALESQGGDGAAALQDEARYGAEVLPCKVAIDQAYLARATLPSDLRILGLTLRLFWGRMRGRAVALPADLLAPITGTHKGQD